MLTPDQLKLRLDRIPHRETDTGMAALIDLLAEVLPELIATTQGQSARYRDQQQRDTAALRAAQERARWQQASGGVLDGDPRMAGRD